MDPNNCRVVFVLDMEHLGQTMVDVNIVNKIISMNVFANKRWEPIFHSFKEELGKFMEEQGYQLSTLQISEWKKQAAQAKMSFSPPKSFQGVDMRI